jgi:phage terminase large subunit-like protein
MSEQATLTIPKPLHDQARRVAQNQQHDVDDLIAEVLAYGLLAVDVAPTFSEQDREIKAFQQMYSDLLMRFADEYIAIFEAELVDHDADFVALLERVEQKYPDDFVLIRPVRKEPEIIYEHRAVRWV